MTEARPGAGCAYLLHLWPEAQDQVWRASLRTVAGEQEIAFANLDELFVYLLRQTEGRSGARDAQKPSFF